MDSLAVSADAIGYKPAKLIPSMLTDDERALYYSIAMNEHEMRGSIIEIGTWLGSGTFEICRGLSASFPHWRLIAIDRFLWTDFYHQHNTQPGLMPGDSFESKFVEYLSDYQGNIDIVACELSDLGTSLEIREPIETMFIDAPKSWRMTHHVLGYFGPHLLAGGRLVFQDFFHIGSRQLIWLLMSLPQIRFTAHTATGTSAQFEILSPIANIEESARRDFRKTTVDDLLRLWGRVREELPPGRVPEMAAGLALDLIERNTEGRAFQVLEEGIVATGHGPRVLAQVDRLIRKAGKEAPKYEMIRGFLRSALGTRQ